MNLTMPKISVLVPVYNVENYISKCLDSIINQTYKNLEIIIVDDGSVDKSGRICDDYSKIDNRIILVHQEHQGVSMARNKTLDIATGSYLGFVDSDDWIEPDMFHTLYNNTIKYGADIAVCNFLKVNELEENFSKEDILNADEQIVVLEGFNKIADNIRRSNNCLWNKLFKRHLFNNLRFPKDKIYEDIFTMHKLIDNADKVVISSQCKYFYRIRNTGITLSPFNIHQLDNIEAYIERYKYITPKYPDLEKTCLYYIFSSLLWYMNIAYISGKIEIYKESLQKIINDIKHYDYNDCGLSNEEINTLKLIFTNIKTYIVARKLHDKKMIL